MAFVTDAKEGSQLMVFRRTFTPVPPGALICRATPPGGTMTQLPRRPEQGEEWRAFTCNGCKSHMEVLLKSSAEIARDTRRSMWLFLLAIVFALMGAGIGVKFFLDGDWGNVAVCAMATGFACWAGQQLYDVARNNVGVKDFRSSMTSQEFVRTHRYNSRAG